MEVYGITGGIGMGKSAAARLLRERSVLLIDTDDLARDLVQPGKPALEAITKVFGREILAPGGELRRADLAARVFADSAARAALESILHPPIREAWLARVGQWRTEGAQRAVVVIPLLFETNAQALFDAVICVACSEATQAKRLLARGWAEGEIARRVAAQLPIHQKMSRADFVVWTDVPLAVHGEQLEVIIP